MSVHLSIHMSVHISIQHCLASKDKILRRVYTHSCLSHFYTHVYCCRPWQSARQRRARVSSHVCAHIYTHVYRTRLSTCLHTSLQSKVQGHGARARARTHACTHARGVLVKKKAAGQLQDAHLTSRVPCIVVEGACILRGPERKKSRSMPTANAEGPAAES